MSLYKLEGNGQVTITGQLDRDTLSRDWWAMLSSAEKRQLTEAGSCLFDLTGVARADSAGLAWLINAIRDTKRHQITLRLQAVPEKVIKLAKISGVDTLLPIDNNI
ncbi:STAS domain-containing protein [Alteromonas sp. ASW11-19]|uniref:STAS domain-containing protein n=1 Tax=Alteromonas salexigens TaxID=2982530 RepID=A0ABT2VIY9_9ALTE|nr:STAS domain-containing protein [Alteromonas salexigens]MCU7553147.1 STAS domain-containing protein [Alteromonas salexigens]